MSWTGRARTPAYRRWLYGASVDRDIHRVVGFALRRRLRHEDVRDAARRVLFAGDLEAFRLLLSAIRERGVYEWPTSRAMKRLAALPERTLAEELRAYSGKGEDK